MDINFDAAFASEATKSAIQEETWRLGWVEVVGGINGVPTAQQFNEVCYIIDSKSNLAYKKALEALTQATRTSENLGNYATKDYTDTADSATLAAAKSYAAPLDHTHTTSDITDFPAALPANGGNAATVNGHTVDSDVPANAKYTDTVYTHPTYTARTGVPTANQTPAFGGAFAVTQPVSDSTGHITAMTSRNVTIPSTAASASAAGLVTTGAQTFGGAKTFAGQLIPAGASDTATPQARKIYAGTEDMEAGVSALETGTIYLVYE